MKLHYRVQKYNHTLTILTETTLLKKEFIVQKGMF